VRKKTRQSAVKNESEGGGGELGGKFFRAGEKPHEEHTYQKEG